MADTVLTLSGIGVVPLSGRGLTERLTPVSNGELRRTVNGTLVDTTLTAHRKYTVSISGSDVQPAALNAVWRGQSTTVQCITELAQQVTFTAGVANDVILGRKPVTSSGRAIVRLADVEYVTSNVTFETTGGVHYADIAYPTGIATGLTATGFVMFRPELTCMVENWNSDTDEWAAAPGFTLDLAEV